ncbi:GGDEF domain-containing protein, partial [candidate division WOR-3 bacterium]|nr:GGDEF domain-containing protein [candidate division WOR-3 bacterium]
NMKETEFKRIPILYPGEHIKKGYQSFILFPIIDPHGESADNRLVLLFVNKSQKIRYDEKMVRDIITPTANIFATAIERSLLYEKVKDLAIKDGLTGLYNHRYFQTTLKEMLREAQVNRYPIALIMIDIDYFKSFNDKYGHQTGDRVLKHLAEIIKRIIPSNALPARYGGEEFVVVLPNKNENQAVEFAEQLRSAVENTSIKYNNTLLKITISLGVAVFDGKYLSSDILIKHADLALYDSKKNGRNKTTIH